VEVRIEGHDSRGNGIMTNIQYLKENIDRLLTF